jgi:predicted MFS family arabinose efflux permease
VEDSAGSRGWAVVVSYSAVAGASQLLWLTYAPVTTAAARHYGVSVTAIGWLANVFPLLYVVLAVPAGLALDRWPRPALAIGAALTALGGIVRLGGDSFGWALAGQLMVAVAQPLVLNAITGVVGCSRSVPARQASPSARLGSFSEWCWRSVLELRLAATILWRWRPGRQCSGC